jgi:ADP-heptose:LPS heptosyltransferase
MKNFLIRTLLSAFKRFRKANLVDERFLIVSTTGLGDTLWGTPALKALRKAHPHAYIAVLTSKIGKELLEHNPYLDELFLIDTPWWQLVRTLKKKQIGTALVFHTSQRMVLPLCFLIGASKIVGTKGLCKGLDHILTTALEQKPLHEIARRLEIVSGPPMPDPLLELFTSQADEDAAEQFLAKHALPSYIPLIGIHPGAKDKFKQWHPSCFVTLGNQLKEHLGAQILVTGNASEKELVTEIASKIKGAIAVSGELGVRPLAALIKKMGLFIVNDTGPMHIAFAMRTPTVALFGPTDPKLCGPYLATEAFVIRKPPTCAPCLRKSCREPFCLLQISPQEVYDAALTLYYGDPHGSSSLHHRLKQRRPLEASQKS